MGASSSRTKRTHYDVSHTVAGEVITADVTYNRKDITKRKDSVKSSIKKKNSVKVKNRQSVKKPKCGAQGHDSMGGNSTDIGAGSPGRAGRDPRTDHASPLYRKKSSCLSCDARDILLGKGRSRSGSEKSLRFSDFNKVIRQTRLDEWQLSRVDIPIKSIQEPLREEICYICEVYTGSHIRACRVCCRAYHDSCLAKIGHRLLDKCRHLIARNKWSCHQCASLNLLLTQQEVTALFEQLQQLDIPKDNVTEADYLRFCRHSLQLENKMFSSETEQAAIRRYRCVAGPATAGITYNQVLDLESIRILGRRCKDSLVHLLTRAELAEARKIFQNLDINHEGVIHKSAVLSSQLCSMSRTAAHYGDDSIMYMDEDLDSLVTWADFLRDTAIYFLGQRPNCEDAGSQGSINDDTEDGAVTFSSCGSLDVDHEHYSKCNHGLEPTGSAREPGLVEHAASFRIEPGQKSAGPPSSRSEPGQEPAGPPSSRSALLDVIDSEIDRCRCLHPEVGGEAGATGLKQPHDEAMDGECTALPQTPTGLHVSQPDSSTSPKSSKTGNSAGHAAASCWAETGTYRVSVDKSRSSPYNDSHQDPIPWEDVESIPGHRGKSDVMAGAASRRSEVILRQTGYSYAQARSVSHSAPRPGPGVVSPACGV